MPQEKKPKISQKLEEKETNDTESKKFDSFFTFIAASAESTVQASICEGWTPKYALAHFQSEIWHKAKNRYDLCKQIHKLLSDQNMPRFGYDRTYRNFKPKKKGEVKVKKSEVEAKPKKKIEVTDWEQHEWFDRFCEFYTKQWKTMNEEDKCSYRSSLSVNLEDAAAANHQQLQSLISALQKHTIGDAAAKEWLEKCTDVWLAECTDYGLLEPATSSSSQFENKIRHNFQRWSRPVVKFAAEQWEDLVFKHDRLRNCDARLDRETFQKICTDFQGLFNSSEGTPSASSSAVEPSKYNSAASIEVINQLFELLALDQPAITFPLLYVALQALRMEGMSDSSDEPRSLEAVVSFLHREILHHPAYYGYLTRKEAAEIIATKQLKGLFRLSEPRKSAGCMGRDSVCCIHPLTLVYQSAKPLSNGLSHVDEQTQPKKEVRRYRRNTRIKPLGPVAQAQVGQVAVTQIFRHQFQLLLNGYHDRDFDDQCIIDDEKQELTPSASTTTTKSDLHAHIHRTLCQTNSAQIAFHAPPGVGESGKTGQFYVISDAD